MHYAAAVLCVLSVLLLVGGLYSMRRVRMQCTVLHVAGSFVYMVPADPATGGGAGLFLMGSSSAPAVGTNHTCTYSPPFGAPAAFEGLANELTALPVLWALAVPVSFVIMCGGWMLVFAVANREYSCAMVVNGICAVVLLAGGLSLVHHGTVHGRDECAVVASSGARILAVRARCGYAWFVGGAHAPPTPPVDAWVPCGVQCFSGRVMAVGGMQREGAFQTEWYDPLMWGCVFVGAGLTMAIEFVYGPVEE
jgi:hypothetical protein